MTRQLIVALLCIAPLAGAAGLSIAALPRSVPKDYKPKNLKILPTDISPALLQTTMKRMSKALGVRKCSFCHVKETDFADDANAKKSTARAMIRMTIDINRDYFGKPGSKRIDCVTCHNGKRIPKSR